MDYGDALWLKMGAPALWLQPSPLLFRCNPFSDLTARFDGAWRELRAAAVTVHYRADSTAERYRHAIAAAAQADLREAERRLALPADASLQVRVHETPQAARAVTGNEFATLAHPLGSTIDVLCGSAGADLTDLPDLRHEIAHILSVRAHGFTPFFLAEGLAGWVEGRIGRQSLADWALQAQTLALPPLSAILDDDGYFATRPLVNAFVASALLVHYLLEQQGSLEPFWETSGGWRGRSERPLPSASTAAPGVSSTLTTAASSGLTPRRRARAGRPAYSASRSPSRAPRSRSADCTPRPPDFCRLPGIPPLIALPLIALPLIVKDNHVPSSSAPWHRHRVQLAVDVIQGVKHERRARGPRFTPQRADRDAAPTPRRSRQRDARGSPTRAAPARPRPPGGRSGNK